jgi:hypothetical protein
MSSVEAIEGLLASIDELVKETRREWEVVDGALRRLVSERAELAVSLEMLRRGETRQGRRYVPPRGSHRTEAAGGPRFIVVEEGITTPWAKMSQTSAAVAALTEAQGGATADMLVDVLRSHGRDDSIEQVNVALEYLASTQRVLRRPDGIWTTRHRNVGA